MDSDLNVLWANKAFFERLGMNEYDVLGEKCYFLWHRRSSPCPNCPCVEALQSGNIESKERKSAEGRTYLLTAVPIKKDDKIVGVFEIGKEITKELMLQSRVKEIVRHEVFFEIIEDILHHFKNIFTGVSGFAQLLKSKVNDDTSVLYLNKLLESVNRGNEFIKSFSLLKKEPTMKIVFDLNYLIISIQDPIKKIAGDKVEVEFKLTQDIPLIAGDPILIKEVIFELIENSANSIVKKFGEGGRVKILTEIIKTDLKEKVLLEISDNGTGMNDETLNKCCEPLFTTNPTRFGLGLSMVKNIINQHDGKIQIESKLSQGTIVKIYFPKATSQQALGT